MDLAALNRKVISLENRSNVHYSSVSGVAYQVSFPGTTLTIESDGTFKANTVIVADNISADNEERLSAVEEFCDHLESYLNNHTHEISEVIGLQQALDNKADINHTHTKSDITNLDSECGCDNSSDDKDKEEDIIAKIEKEIIDLVGGFSSYKMWILSQLILIRSLKQKRIRHIHMLRVISRI